MFVNLKIMASSQHLKILDTLLENNKIDLDKIIKDSPSNLDDIFIKFGTDKVL